MQVPKSITCNHKQKEIYDLSELNKKTWKEVSFNHNNNTPMQKSSKKMAAYINKVMHKVTTSEIPLKEYIITILHYWRNQSYSHTDNEWQPSEQSKIFLTNQTCKWIFPRIVSKYNYLMSNISLSCLLMSQMTSKCTDKYEDIRFSDNATKPKKDLKIASETVKMIKSDRMMFSIIRKLNC